MAGDRVLLLGGLDPCGGAGITADARVLQHFGAFGLPVALALTVQNRHGLQRLAAVEPSLWQQALQAALADGELHAVKVGLLADAEQIAALAELLRPLAGAVPIVVDPVLSATAGGFAASRAVAVAYCQHLLPLATVVTPNLPELDALAGSGGVPWLLELGCGGVLLKGGHGVGESLCDALTTGDGERRFTHPRLEVGSVHGTGCAFAAALAAQLAVGNALPQAAQIASQFVHDCLLAMGPPDASGLPRPLGLPMRTAGR